MLKPKEDVVIQDPAIEEFGKKHSCIKRTCLSGCGCFLLFLILFVVAINVASHPRSRSLKAIPPPLKVQVPLYDTQNVQKITVIKNTDNNLLGGVLSLVPKMILSPVVVVKPELFLTRPQHGEDAALENLKIFFKKPLSEPKETYTLQWKNLSAELSFIKDYYQSELEKKQFTLKTIQTSTSTLNISFQKHGISGVILGEDHSDKKDGTDFVSVQVSIPKAQ